MTGDAGLVVWASRLVVLVAWTQGRWPLADAALRIRRPTPPDRRVHKVEQLYAARDMDFAKQAGRLFERLVGDADFRDVVWRQRPRLYEGAITATSPVDIEAILALARTGHLHNGCVGTSLVARGAWWWRLRRRCGPAPCLGRWHVRFRAA